MIQTDEELKIVRKQLGRLEAVLQDLEERVRPQSEQQFGLMSEIYVEHIAKLRQEIEAYCAAHGQTRKRAKSTASRKGHARSAARRSA